MRTSGSDTVMLVAVTSEPTLQQGPRAGSTTVSSHAPALRDLDEFTGSRVFAELMAVNPVMLAASIFAVMVVVNCGAAKRPVDSHATPSG